MTSRPNNPSRPAGPPPNASTSSVRRNLFHHHLSRRPASSTSTSTTTAEAAEGNAFSSGREVSTEAGITHPGTIGTAHQHTNVTAHPPTNEIVPRDKNGRYNIDAGMPLMPPSLGGEDEEGEGEEGEGEKEKGLLEMMYRSRGGEEGELLALVQASLQKQAASLEDDRWMYEPEGDLQS